MPRTYVRLSLEERLWRHVNKDGPVLRTDLGPCWLWTGGDNGHGYGTIRPHPGPGSVYVHRLSYELAHGPIPDGLELDHLCRLTRCVRPDHLEPVTQKENHRRTTHPRALRFCLVCTTPFIPKSHQGGRRFCSLRCSWVARRKPKGKCAVAGCGGTVESQSFCSKHRWRFRMYGDPLASAKDRHLAITI